MLLYFSNVDFNKRYSQLLRVEFVIFIDLDLLICILTEFVQAELSRATIVCIFMHKGILFGDITIFIILIFVLKRKLRVTY